MFNTADTELSVLEAKLKILVKLKDLIKVKATIGKHVKEVAKIHKTSQEELEVWAWEQIFALPVEKVIIATPTPITVEAPVVDPSPIAPITVEAPVVEKSATKPAIKRRSAEPDPDLIAFDLSTTTTRRDIVAKTKSIPVLTKAVEDSNRFVRIAAIQNKNTPQRLIIKIVFNDLNQKVRRIGVRFITNQKILEEIAEQSSFDMEVRQGAIRRIKSPVFINHLLANSPPKALAKSCKDWLGRNQK